MPIELPDFEGLPVRQVGIEIRGVAGGLQDAIKVDPMLIHKGDMVRVELLLATRSLRFDPIDRENLVGDQKRVVIFDLDTALVHPPGEHNVEAFAEQKRKIARMREDEQGVNALANDGATAEDWGVGPLDEPAGDGTPVDDVDAESAKVIEGAFGPPPGDDEWVQESPPPPAEKVSRARK